MFLLLFSGSLAFLPGLLALLTGFSKWPSPLGAFGRPARTSYAPSPLYPPPPAHLCFSSTTHFNLFFLSATIHPSSPSLSLSPPSYLSSSLFCISSLVSIFRLTHIVALFLLNLSCSKITLLSFSNITLSKTKLGFHEAKL